MNFLGVIAGVLSLVSVLLPWWGITTQVFGSTTSTMWGFFGGPGHLSDSYGAQNFSSTIVTYSPVILGLALLTTALAIAGSFTPRFRFLALGVATSAAAVVGYAALIGYAIRSSCQGQGCITQLTGSFTADGANVSWGFQTGFYIFIAAMILTLVGLVFHETLTHQQTATTKS